MINKSKTMQIGAMLLFAIISSSTNAQQVNPDSSAAKLASRLKVSKEKAEEIQSAYRYGSDNIRALLSRNDIKPAEKQAQLVVLFRQRRAKVDSVLTPELKIRLLQTQSATESARATSLKQTAQQRNEQRLLKVKHKRVVLQKSDSTKILPKPAKL